MRRRWGSIWRRHALLLGVGLAGLACAADRSARITGPSSPADTLGGHGGAPPVTPSGFRLLVMRGDGQWAKEETAVPDSIELVLTDAQSRPRVGYTVRFVVDAGGGTLADTAAVTDARGRVVAPTWRLGTAGQTQQLRARIDTAAVVIRGVAYRVPQSATGAQQLLFVRGDSILEMTPSEPQPRLVRLIAPGFAVQALSGDSLLALVDLVGQSVCVGPLRAARLTCAEVPGYGNFWAFAWAPDGGQLVFHAQQRVACAMGNGVCYIASYATMALDSRTMTVEPLRVFGARLETPRWSPDGATVAFTQDGTLWLMARDGSGRRQLPLPSNVSVMDLQWSPSGEQLALIVWFQDRCPWTCDSGVALVNVRGGGYTQLVDASASRGESVATPLWSPDGLRVAFTFEQWASAGHYTSDVYSTSTAQRVPIQMLRSATLLSWR